MKLNSKGNERGARPSSSNGLLGRVRKCIINALRPAKHLAGPTTSRFEESMSSLTLLSLSQGYIQIHLDHTSSSSKEDMLALINYELNASKEKENK